MRADGAHLSCIESSDICLRLMRALTAMELFVEVLTADSFCRGHAKGTTPGGFLCQAGNVCMHV